MLALAGILIAARALPPRTLLNLEGAFGLIFLTCIFWKRSGKLPPHADTPALWNWAMGALLCATVAVFSPELPHYFVADDFWHLSKARIPVDFSLLCGAYRPFFFRPLGFLAYRCQWLWAGDQPWRWHLSAILAHVAICWMVYLLGKRLYGRREIGFWAAALFAWHGLHPEVVAWNSCYFDLLATGFGLGALLLLLRDLEEPRVWVLSSALACEAAALLAKESAYCLPLLATLLVLWRSPQKWSRTIPFWGTAMVMFAVRWYALGGLGGYDAHLSPIHTVEGVGLRMWALLWFPVNGTVAAGGLLRFSLAGALGAGVLLTWTRARRSDLLLALGFTLLASLPALSQLMIGADLARSRYLYLPSIGFALLVGVTLGGMDSKWRVAAGAALLLFHLAATERNLAVWGEVVNLAQRTCESAAAQIAGRERKVTVAGVPHSVYGVQFYHAGLPECIAMQGEPAEVEMVAEGTPGATFVWDKARLALVRQTPLGAPGEAGVQQPLR